MSNVQSYNALIDRFKAFASGHFILKTFSHGQIDTADLEKFTEYPFMHVVPSNVTYAKGTKTFSFQIVLADLPRDKDDKVEFQREVLSDLQRIAEDLVAEITNHRVLFGDLITVQNVSLEPFLEEFHNTLTGWTVSLELLVPYYWDACSIPAEWNDFFESGSGGTGSILTFVDSITRDENGNVSLVNDEATPAPNYYYGTNDEGVRGWYLLTDEVGLTCATIGTCQTIIDIEAAIDDLQTEILLKANTVDISAVGFSNDYDDLDNLPNLSGYGDMFKSVYDTDVDGVVDSAERIQIVVRNSTGSTLTKGQIVYLSGATGNRPNAVLAQANTEATSSKTIGMVIADIANNTDGQIAVNGTLHDLDTSAFTAGDTLWLSATTAGGMVANTPPSEPNHTVFIGYVARSHPNLGRIVLAIQNGYELDELHGVQITTPLDNQALVYESASSLWKNETIDKTFVGLGNVDNTSDANKPISTATQTALNAKQDTLVSGTNIKTINGNSVLGSGDLVVGGSTSLAVGTTPITSGTVGRVLFEGTGNVLQQSANLFWDNVNNRLGIGTASPANTLDVSGTTRVQGNVEFGLAGAIDTNFLFNCGTRYGGQAKFSIIGQGATGSYIGIGSGAFATTGDNFVFAKAYLNEFGNSCYGFVGLNNALAMTFRFGAFGSSVEALRLTNTSVILRPTTGNVLIGTTTDAGFKLDVNGTSRFRNVANFAAESAGFVPVLQVENTGSGATANKNVALFIGNRGNAANIDDNTNIGIWQRSNIVNNYGNLNFFNTSGTLTAFVSCQYASHTSATGNLIFGNANAGTITEKMRLLANGNLLINTTTDVASSILTIASTTKGFLPPRMTTTQKNAIASPAAGLVVYDTTLNKLCVYTTAWETITSA